MARRDSFGGYEEERFENKVDIILQCSICLKVLKDPVRCRNEHYFCRSCIQKYLRENSETCPMCQHHLTEETLTKSPRILMDFLQSLMIRCDHENRGCRELIKLEFLDRHVNSCDYSPTRCTNPGCVEVMNRHEKERHEREQCQFRNIVCDECGEQVIGNIKSSRVHPCFMRKEMDDLARFMSKTHGETTWKRYVRNSKSKKIAALKPKYWEKVSVKHREKFDLLSEVWENAIKCDPELITIINDNGVCFKEEFSIGSGSYGTEVYICLGSDGIERAIKRLPKILCNLLKNERDILTSRNAVESPRVVNYCFYDDTSSPDYGYLILNLYEQNLEEFVKKEGEKITESRARTMIRQVLEGLKALHAREPRILHRDLKPTNILVNVNGDLVLSDFGIGRFFPEQGATTYCTNGEHGSRGWVAYECIDWDDLCSEEMRDIPKQLKWKEKSDIQVAGMLAFYILTKGKHPFGPQLLRMINLQNGNPVGLSKLSDPVVKDLLSQMLARELDERPYVEQALKHPYFLPSEEQMKFLEAVGNEPEVKNFKGHPNCAVSRELDNLDLSKPRSSLLPNDWKAVIDPDDLNTFCAGHTPASRFDGSRYTHCLRFIRNVRQHWGDKRPRPPLKAMGMATSLDEYFLQLFPTLPLVLHQIIRKHPDWKARSSVKEFFPVINRRAGYDAD